MGFSDLGRTIITTAKDRKTSALASRRYYGAMLAQRSRCHTASPSRVVIVGGGFAGLAVARALKGTPARVSVVDRSNHHVFQPLLYQVATASLSPSSIARPIRAALRDCSNCVVALANVTRIDLGNRRVHGEVGSSEYDYLVLAAGARHDYFGHDHWGIWLQA
jgi:NADH dehydrogenase